MPSPQLLSWRYLFLLFSSSCFAFLTCLETCQLLGLLPTVKGVSLQYTSPYVNSPCVQKLLEDGTIKQLDSSSSDFEDFSGLTLTALQGQPKYNSSFVYFDASQDPGPLKVIF